MAERDYYADLKLTQYATTAQIKSAFHTLAKQHHPDKSGSNDASAFRRAREAYEVLSDATTKAAYDRNYQHAQVQYQPEDEQFSTRTAAFEAEEAERQARGEPVQPKRYSPPPYKPVRKPNEPGWAYYMGKAYQAWEKRDAAYRARHPEYENRP